MMDPLLVKLTMPNLIMLSNGKIDQKLNGNMYTTDITPLRPICKSSRQRKSSATRPS